MQCDDYTNAEMIDCYMKSSISALAERHVASNGTFCYLPQLPRWTDTFPTCATRDQVG